jgi:serine/threonine protein kinase
MEAAELIRALLSYNPLTRPSLREILQHPWFHSGRLIRYNLYDAKFDYRLQIDTRVLEAVVALGYS